MWLIDLQGEIHLLPWQLCIGCYLRADLCPPSVIPPLEDVRIALLKTVDLWCERSLLNDKKKRTSFFTLCFWKHCLVLLQAEINILYFSYRLWMIMSRNCLYGFYFLQFWTLIESKQTCFNMDLCNYHIFLFCECNHISLVDDMFFTCNIFKAYCGNI